MKMLWVVAILLFAGCVFDSGSNNKSNPEPESIVGVWKSSDDGELCEFTSSGAFSLFQEHGTYTLEENYLVLNIVTRIPDHNYAKYRYTLKDGTLTLITESALGMALHAYMFVRVQ